MPNILVVDDRKPERQYLATLLQHVGHCVTEAEDGQDAFARMRALSPDLVISDIVMPTMDGFEFVRRVRDNAQTRNIPVIFYTAAYDDAATRALAEACVQVTLLPKPSEPDLVLRTVEGVLRESHLQPPVLGNEFRGAHLEMVTTKLHQKMEDLERANAELSQKESQLRLVTDAVPVLICFVDPNQRLQFANRAHERWFGHSPDELRSKHLAEVWGKRAYYKMAEYVEKALAGQRVTFETLLNLKEGNEKAVRATYVPEFAANGTVRGFVALVEDLSEIKAVESALRESNSRLELALAAGSIGTWDYDPAVGEMSCDARSRAAFGLPADAPGKYDSFFAGLHPDDGEHVERALQAALDPATAGQFDEEFRTVGLRDGLVRHVHAQGKASFWMLRGERTAVGLIGTVQDITSRKRDEEALRRANDNLQQFAYATAHELQEPLRNIVNSLALLTRLREESGSEATELINESASNAQRLLQMVKDLLAYTQITHDHDQKIDLVKANDIVTQVLSNLSLSISESRARITCGRLPLVRILPTHLLQLFQNLIGNALKYRKPEQPPAVEISAVRMPSEWLFTVADNGIGFEPAYASRIFGIFKRLHTKREYPGTGIGLALCSRIISAYGGRIWAEAQPGVGASFRFTLPFQERPPSER